MQKNIYSIISQLSLLSILFVINSESYDSWVLAAETNKEEAVTLEQLSTPSAIRLSIIDGIIDFVGETKRARVNLAWEPLPPPLVYPLKKKK